MPNDRMTATAPAEGMPLTAEELADLQDTVDRGIARVIDLRLMSRLLATARASLRTDADVRAAAEEMREACADLAYAESSQRLSRKIRALPLPASSALEARAQAAVEKEREACAAWHSTMADEFDKAPAIREWHSQCAAAIRARKGGAAA